MNEIYYERFLSRIYDDSPYFGQGRSRELEEFNRFYYEHLKGQKEPILEFGSGTGMLSIPLARRGHRLDSVDISPYMQEVLAEKLQDEHQRVSANINQITADAIAYRGDSLYESIVMPEGILIAIPDVELQIALLDSCHKNLKPRGRIYTDFFQPRYKIIYNKTLREVTRFKTKGGDVYLMEIVFDNDEYTQIQDWKVAYTKMEGGAKMNVVEVNVRFRYIFYSEIQLMLKQCGFKVIDIDVNYANRLGFAVIAEKR